MLPVTDSTKMAQTITTSHRVSWICLCFFSLIISAFLTTVQVAQAESDDIYQPVGAPADPKVSVQWNRFHDYAEVTKLLKSMVKAHPSHARLQSLGRSYGGREMWLLTVTNFDNKSSDKEKPAFWIDGGLHANEIQGTEVALYTAWYLLEMAGRNPTVTRLLDERTFYVMPMMSPDSRDAHMYQPNTTHSPRTGQRPRDDDRDGLVDEDGPDDLDGDGHITQMRVRDPAGRWKAHPRFPELMIQVAPDETGDFQLIGQEGFDNDGDGQFNEDGPGSYDPNRNWAWQWQPEYVERGADRYPFSVPENRMVADFVLAHQNIAGAQTLHNMSGLILRGPGMIETPYEPADVQIFDALATRGLTMLPHYAYKTAANDLYRFYGSELDWFYGMRGVITFCNELFTRKEYFREHPPEKYPDRAEREALFNEYLLFGAGLVPWHEVDHPQFGKVEVGGWTKNWRRQPPSFMLEESCHRNMAFLLYHADQMPQVRIASVDTKPLDGGLIQITATITNHKLTPTRTAQDLKHRITPPDTISIEGKRVRVIAGLSAADPFFLHSTAQEHHPEKLRVSHIPSMGKTYVRWLVEGKGPYTVRVHSYKGGSDTKTKSEPRP